MRPSLQALSLSHIPGEENIAADILSKHWSYAKVWPMLQPLLFFHPHGKSGNQLTSVRYGTNGLPYLGWPTLRGNDNGHYFGGFRVPMCCLVEVSVPSFAFCLTMLCTNSEAF